MDDFDWGEDPFAGDFDFDSDFDSPGKKSGFIKSFATGFLSGLVDNSVGSTDARVKTLGKILPKSWEDSFSNISKINRRTAEVVKNIKESSHDTVVDLQAISASISKRLPENGSNRIRNSLLKFSDKDFSDWERHDSSSPSDDGMGEVDDDEVTRVLEMTNANSMLDRENDNNNTRKTLDMMGEVGGRQIAGINLTVTQLTRSNSLLESMLDHQLKVKAKSDAMQLNILARTYMTNVKYYKFMEKVSHRTIAELKAINEFTRKSDYEKTSHSQAFRKTIRDSVYSTVKSKAGGLASFLDNKLSKGSLDQRFGGAQGMTSMLRMGLEMSEGMPVNVGQMMGGMASSVFIDQLPNMVNSKQGKKWLDQFKKTYPEQAKFFEKQYKALEDLGNFVGSVTNNPDAIYNNLMKHHKGEEFDEHETYQEYKASLGGSKGLSRAQWLTLKKLKGTVNKAVGAGQWNVGASDGTKISMSSRTVNDSFENSYWSKQNSRSINEVIPAWLSQIHLSIEKMRTGNENLDTLTYDYKKASFVTKGQAAKNIASDIFNVGDYTHQAGKAKDLVGKLDVDGLMDNKTRNQLAFMLMRDADKDLGLNPYNYLGSSLEGRGLKPEQAKLIEASVMSAFGITADDVSRFQVGTDADRLKLMTYMNNPEARKRLKDLQSEASGLKDFFPDFTNKLDIHKENDYSSLLRSGIIKQTEYGTDEFNMDLVWDSLKEIIDDPSKKELSVVRRLNRGRGGPSDMGSNRGISPFSPTGGSGGVGFDEEEFSHKMSNAVEELNRSIETLTRGVAPLADIKIDNTPIVTSLDTTNERLSLILERFDVNNNTLKDILLRQPKHTQISSEEEKVLEKEKKSIIERIKGFNVPGLFDKGINKILDHEPLMLGSLLGGLAGVAYFNPKAAGLIAGGMGAMYAYGKIKDLAKARNPDDSEDLYEEGASEPILEAWKLRNGKYYDLVSKKIISSYSEIKGSVKDLVTDVVIGARTLANKLFTQENKEVFLSGLDAARKWLVKSFKLLDPMGRISKLKDSVTSRLFQMDVYKEGQDSPTLIGKFFANGKYFKKGEDGNLIKLNGWNEIDGAVYDDLGNVLITKEEYENGLRTSAGVNITRLTNKLRSLGGHARNLLGRFKDKVSPALKATKDRIASGLDFNFEPVVSSVDRIFDLLMHHWSYKPEDVIFGNRPRASEENLDPTGQGDYTQQLAGVANTDAGVAEQVRLNSIEHKKQLAQEDRVERTLTALESIAGMGKEEEDDDKPKKGLFGMIGGALTGIKNLGGKMLGWMGATLPALLTIGKFGLMGLKVFPLMFKAIVGVGSILKWIAAKGSLGGGGGGGVGDLIRGKRGGAMSTGGRLLRGGGLMLAGAAIGQASDYMVESGMIEEGGIADKAMTVGEYASYAGGAALMLKGTAVGGALLTGAGTVLAGIGTVLASPFVIGAAVIGGLAYLGYKAYTKGSGKQLDLRLAQYGVADKGKGLGDKILQLENMLDPYVSISGGNANFKGTLPYEEINKLFGVAADDQSGANEVYAWLVRRFRPVYLTYKALTNRYKFNKLEDYDKDRTVDSYTIAERAHNILVAASPLPYDVVTLLDKKEPLMGRQQTIIKVQNFLKQLQGYIKRTGKDKVEHVKDTVINTKEGLELSKVEQLKALEEAQRNKDRAGIRVAKKNLKQIDKQLEHYKKDIYNPTIVDAEISVTDMLPPGKPIDPLTSIRLALYGNDLDVGWRCEAVLRLERYAEKTSKGDDNYTKVELSAMEAFELFKGEFRLEETTKSWYNVFGDYDWEEWYNGRFLPVFARWTALVKSHVGSEASRTWKRLNATQKHTIAKYLINVQIIPKGKTDRRQAVSIWDSPYSPFEGESSTTSKKKALALLNKLERESKDYLINNPDVDESGRDINREKANEAIMKKQQELLDARANKRKVELDSKKASSLTTPKGTTSFASRSLYNGPPTGEADIGPLTYGDVKINPGDDNGISIPKGTAIKSIIRAAHEAGITDPREIAFLIANADHETQGFAKTAENTKYSDPNRLLKIFPRKVGTKARAIELTKLGAPGTANAIYSGVNGNTLPTDGWNYRGSGMIQLTGRGNFRDIGNYIGEDIESNPKAVREDPDLAAKTLIGFYQRNGIGAKVRAGDLMGGIDVINRGEPRDIKNKRIAKFNSYLKELTKDDFKLINEAMQGTPLGETASVALAESSKRPVDELRDMNAGAPAPADSIKPPLPAMTKGAVVNENYNPVNSPVTGKVTGQNSAVGNNQSQEVKVTAEVPHMEELKDAIQSGNGDLIKMLAAVVAELKSVNQNTQAPTNVVSMS